MKTITATITVAFLALLAECNAAKADWQYTRWGMTQEQVVAASHGNVPTSCKPPKDTCIGIYKIGKFNFVVFFRFGKFGLNSVNLLPSSSTTSQEVLQALQEKYGMWMPGLVWIDRTNNYSVEFDSHLGITYRPLHAAENRGL